MKLVVETDPLQDLESLLNEALSGRHKVKHIAVSATEMREIVTHKRAKEVIPDYLKPQMQRLQRCHEKMTSLKNNQETEEHKLPQQEFFDKMTELEKEEGQITEVIPKQFTQSGILIITSMQA